MIFQKINLKSVVKLSNTQQLSNALGNFADDSTRVSSCIYVHRFMNKQINCSANIGTVYRGLPRDHMLTFHSTQ